MDETSSLTDIVIDRAAQVVSTPHALSCIGIAAQFRISCEGWLKLELLRDLAFSLVNDVDAEVWPERYFPLAARGRRHAADLAVRRGAEQVFVQLKTFPTNYGAAGKPITNSIDSVVTDLDILRTRRGSASGLVVWLAYPIPDPMPPTWPTHLAKVESAAASTRHEQKLKLHDGFAHLHVMESR